MPTREKREKLRKSGIQWEESRDGRVETGKLGHKSTRE